MQRFRRTLAASALGLSSIIALTACGASPGDSSGGGDSLEDVTLTIAAMNDPFTKSLQAAADAFNEETGANVTIDVLGYPELATKVRSDFVGGTANYDLLTMDIVWTGEFAEQGWTTDLTDLIAADADEIDVDDVLPVTWSQGKWEDKQVAFPLAGYANLLNYRTDVFDSLGLSAPETLEDVVAAAKTIAASDAGVSGWVANGQQGPASAQDWMAYSYQMGGAVLDADGTPVVDSDINVEALTLYKELFDCCAPAGATDFDWGQRETSFTQGQAAQVETWSVSRASYEDESMSTVAGNVATVPAPMAAGLDPKYAFGGWGLAINADSQKQDAAWEFIKYVTSKEVQKTWVENGGGSYIRTSTLEEPDLVAAFPWQPVILAAMQNGDGDARPRTPEYSQIEEAIGSAVSKVLTQGIPPKDALSEAQESVEKLLG